MYIFKKASKSKPTSIEFNDMISFYKMILKMKKRRPHINIHRIMKLTYSENSYNLFKTNYDGIYKN